MAFQLIKPCFQSRLSIRDGISGRQPAFGDSGTMKPTGTTGTTGLIESGEDLSLIGNIKGVFVDIFPDSVVI